MNRVEIQVAYIDEVISGMDTNTLIRVATEALEAEYDKYSDEQLINEIQEYYPDLLESYELRV